MQAKVHLCIIMQYIAHLVFPVERVQEEAPDTILYTTSTDGGGFFGFTAGSMSSKASPGKDSPALRKWAATLFLVCVDSQRC
jgi:hypothetical protein